MKLLLQEYALEKHVTNVILLAQSREFEGKYLCLIAIIKLLLVLSYHSHF